MIIYLVINLRCHQEVSDFSQDIQFPDPGIQILITDDSTVKLSVSPISYNSAIEKVIFLINKKTVATLQIFPYEYEWKDLDMNKQKIYNIEVIAYDYSGLKNHVTRQIEINNYRNKYIGKYTFKIIDEQWRLGQATTSTTFYYEGEIRKFIPKDSDHDLYNGNSENENPLEKITIEFNNDTNITSLIDVNGRLTEKHQIHYCHSGGFQTNDTINFTVGCLGGLGGGNTYIVQGVRR